MCVIPSACRWQGYCPKKREVVVIASWYMPKCVRKARKAWAGGIDTFLSTLTAFGTVAPAGVDSGIADAQSGCLKDGKQETTNNNIKK